MGDHTHKHIFIFFYLREICPRQLPQTHVCTSTEPDLVMGWAASTRVPKHQGPQGGVVEVVWDILWTSDPTLVTRTEGCPYRHLHARPRLQGQSMKRRSALLEGPTPRPPFLQTAANARNALPGSLPLRRPSPEWRLLSSLPDSTEYVTPQSYINYLCNRETIWGIKRWKEKCLQI